ncbi:MAG TPA: zinc ribbon domain-containing protein, partial [Candidatus Obscuribacter sp.]|nr:zinc ribbon domain-containing protein [Candidatus Obscuribacter sp.]
MLTGELTNSNFASQPLNSITPQVVGCSRCRSRIEITAKFCGNCGAPQAQKTLPPGSGRSLAEDLSQVSLKLSESDIEASNRLNKEQAQKAKAQAMPSFARKRSRRIAPELREEMNTIYMM